jgi:hypothetical protein
MTSDKPFRRVIAKVALATFILSGAWTIVLLTFGGFDASILGVRVTTHEPLRPAAFTVVALVVLTAMVGIRQAAMGIRKAIGATNRVLEAVWRLADRIDDRIPVGVIAATVVVVGVMCGSKAAGGSDSYGYVSEAELWLHGRLAVAQPWVSQAPWPDAVSTFAPLGYHPVQTPTTIVPTYSPGLPMLMAAAKFIAGPCAIFWIVPLSGGLLMVATFGIARRLGSPRAGLVATWLVATSPAFLFMLMAPMSDVPTAAAWAVVVWLATAGTMALAIAAGLVATLAVLLRPNLVPMAGIIALWFVLEAWRAPQGDRGRHLSQGAGFLAALSPAIVTMAALNQFWNGSPLRSGYGSLGDLFAWANISTNVRNYATWFSDTQTPLAFLGIAALLLPIGWLWPAGARRSIVTVTGLFVVAVWAEYCTYSPFDAWWYLRFLLPCWPFVMIGFATVLLRPARSGRPLVGLAVAVIVLALGTRGLARSVHESVFDQQRGESKYPSAAQIVRTRTEPNAVIFSGMHSGSVRYYAGRTTLTFFSLDGQWLDRAVAWLSEHGAHPYALLEDWEVKEFKQRFGAANAVGRLEMMPMVEYDGPSKLYLFDLLCSSASARCDQVDRIFDSALHPHCVPPASQRALVLR